ncbi:MAG: hypothetical protein RL189_2063 [Pseudomonadota bacterium]
MRLLSSTKVGLFASLLALAGAEIAGCRKVDTSKSTGMATKPSELFSTDSKKRCVDRAAQLTINQALQDKLCERATSSAPVDCYKRKTSQGVVSEAAVMQCRTPNLPR